MRNLEEMGGVRDKGVGLEVNGDEFKGYLNRYSGKLYAYVFR